MSLTLDGVVADGWAARSPLINGRTVGPVTAAHQRRALIIYLTFVAAGLAPWLLGGTAALKAAGLGMVFPGAGFVAAVGLWAVLATPLALLLFAVSLFVWFGTGMVLAPLIVWFGAAALAGAVATEAWAGAPPLVIAFAAAGSLYVAGKARAGRAAAAQARARRDETMRTMASAVLATAAPEPDPLTRELTEDDLASLRYILDRGLQPPESFAGFDVVDQFQTASLRYQINNAGYALCEIQTNYLPNLRGYYETAQLNLVAKYLQPKVWGYWRLETSWGHLNLVNHDPVGKDNIMLTGWLALHVGMYMLATGDRRFLEPGSLTFRRPGGKAYVHDATHLVGSVVDNYAAAPFCIYPCEPNWAYPICNYIGFSGLAVMDAVTGTRHTDDLRDRWLANLDAEFTDESGSIVGLRSTLTGLRFPFPGGELGFVNYQEVVEPRRAWRMWSVARTELQAIVAQGEGGARVSLPGRGFDFGNYGPGFGGVYAAVQAAAREFGDDTLAEAAARALDADCGPAVAGGVRAYAKTSNLSNISAIVGRVRRRGDFRRAVLEGPHKPALQGPLLTGLKYPDVLVARAISVDGAGLDLVMYPGVAAGEQTIELSRLRPGAVYAVTGAAVAEVRADGDGRATLVVHLDGRTEVLIRPAA